MSLVKRLRDAAARKWPDINAQRYSWFNEAADEIERLQKRVERAEHHNELLRQVDELEAVVERLTAERDTWEKRAAASIWALTQMTAERDALREFADVMRDILAVGIVAGPCPTPRQWAEIQCMADKLVTAIDAARKA